MTDHPKIPPGLRRFFPSVEVRTTLSPADWQAVAALRPDLETIAAHYRAAGTPFAPAEAALRELDDFLAATAPAEDAPAND